MSSTFALDFSLFLGSVTAQEMLTCAKSRAQKHVNPLPCKKYSHRISMFAQYSWSIVDMVLMCGGWPISQLERSLYPCVALLLTTIFLSGAQLENTNLFCFKTSSVLLWSLFSPAFVYHVCFYFGNDLFSLLLGWKFSCATNLFLGVLQIRQLTVTIRYVPSVWRQANACILLSILSAF